MSESQSIWLEKKVWFGFLITALCFALIAYYVDLSEVWEAFKKANYFYVLISALLMIIFMLIRTVRWRFLLGEDAPFKELFHIQNIGYMLTNILPLRIGDLARAVLVGTVPPLTIAQGISTMVIERVLDLLFMVILFPIVVASLPNLPDWLRNTAELFALLTMIASFILILAANQRPLAIKITRFFLSPFPEKLRDGLIYQIEQLLLGLVRLTRLKDGIWLLALTIFTWVPILFSYHFSLLAFSLPTTAVTTSFVMCVAAFSVAAPSAPGGAGVFHGAVTTAIVTVLGWPEASAASFAFLYHGLTLLMMVILGLISLQFINIPLSQIIARTKKRAN